MAIENSSRLARRLHTQDAVILGLGSMIGAGIFVSAGPAAAAAGTGLLLAVVLAGGIAWLNAATMAQLAALYPESGGTYVYGRKRLGPLWGFLAGWAFVVGKLASCMAMALTFASYAAPDFARPLAVAAVLSLTLVNYCGVKKTAAVTRGLVILVLASLSLVAFAALAGGALDFGRVTEGRYSGGMKGLLEATGLMFFAFAGYARIATLGEELVDPKTTIPRAISLALGLTLAIYLFIITTAVLTVDIDQLAGSSAPLRLAVESGRFEALAPVVRVGACLASLSVLLSLMAGIGRTIFAMAANGDLPRSLSAVHPRYKVPHRAELMVGFTVTAGLSLADLRTAIGFSSFAILGYYAIANCAAWTLPKEQRLWPRWMAGLGLLACVTVAFSLPAVSIGGGLLLLFLGLGVWWLMKPRAR